MQKKATINLGNSKIWKQSVESEHFTSNLADITSDTLVLNQRCLWVKIKRLGIKGYILYDFKLKIGIFFFKLLYVFV